MWNVDAHIAQAQILDLDVGGLGPVPRSILGTEAQQTALRRSSAEQLQF